MCLLWLSIQMTNWIPTIVMFTCQGHVKVRVHLTGACTWQGIPEHLRYGVVFVPRMRTLKPKSSQLWNGSLPEPDPNMDVSLIRGKRDLIVKVVYEGLAPCQNVKTSYILVVWYAIYINKVTISIFIVIIVCRKVLIFSPLLGCVHGIQQLNKKRKWPLVNYTSFSAFVSWLSQPNVDDDSLGNNSSKNFIFCTHQLEIVIKFS